MIDATESERPERYGGTDELPDRDGRRLAAVAAILAPSARGADILLVRRATYAGDPWSGHIALPGGRHEPSDPTLEVTARRETYEETGIDLEAARRIAVLEDVVPRSVRIPSLVIRPYVFAYEGPRDVTLSSEIAEAWWHPVAELAREEAWRTTDVRVGDATRAVRGYPWQGQVIWGITERILAALFARGDLLPLERWLRS